MVTRLAEVRRFTVDEYFRMAELDILPSGPMELIDGQVLIGGRPWRFTAHDFHRLAEVGILGEDDRVELIYGEGVDMAPAGSRHAAGVKRLVEFFRRRLPDEVILSVQDPLSLAEDLEPQPDLALVHRQADFYAEAHPDAADVLLLIEVSDSSVAYDRVEKADLYARHGIVEYWLVDLTKQAVLVHTSPSPLGYRSVETQRSEDTWTSTLLPSLRVRGEDLLG